ncbi:Panacea domain-containing protein [Bacillus sp. AFS002410]|uniref:Panacea domain-containing protein n=1 Tax=Bacillus sp. AFS002410 TaxID=2033481 RepID=UPI0015CF7229|nr:type II toxin-antitoxin system antitoxin SocA domain-containing protein [Bacillus sp. AFS002410]
MVYSALEVAKWFLVRNNAAINEFGSENLTHLKLQKLMYYAQGIHLAYTSEELFSDELFAWEHGPVAPRVYEEYKGNREILFKPTEDDLNIFKHVQSKEVTRNVLEVVYEHYGKYSAWHLRNMTHDERPWLETQLNDVIDKDLIREFFEAEVLEGNE